MEFMLEIAYDTAMNPGNPMWAKIAAALIFFSLCGTVLFLFASAALAFSAYREKCEAEIDIMTEEVETCEEEIAESENMR